MAPQPITTAEVAQRYRKAITTIRKWVRQGALRPIAGTGGRGGYLFTEAEIERFERTLKPISAY